jgi:hypothetical protein
MMFKAKGYDAEAISGAILWQPLYLRDFDERVSKCIAHALGVVPHSSLIYAVCLKIDFAYFCPVVFLGCGTAGSAPQSHFSAAQCPGLRELNPAPF